MTIAEEVLDIFEGAGVSSPTILINTYEITLKYFENVGPVQLSVYYDHEKSKVPSDSYLDPAPFRCVVSHFINTPNQASAHYTNIYGKSESDSIRSAISYYMNWINQAVEDGKVPESDWLVKNEVFFGHS